MPDTPAARRWRALVEAHAVSGLSTRAFAEQKRVNPRTLTWWRSRLRRADKAAQPLLDRRATIDAEAGWVPGFGEERLLVVAAPAGAQLPAGEVGCRRASLTASDLPASAGLVSQPFTVLEPGRGGCPADVANDASLTDFQAAPRCH
jgi:hypothetical protein